MARLRQFSQRLADAIELIASALLGALVLVIFIGVLDRYLLKTGQAWPDELSRYLLVWASFLAAAVAAHRLGHYTVSYFADRFLGRSPTRRYLAAAVSFLSAGCFCLLIPGALALVNLGSRQVSPVLGTPMWVIFSSILVGLAAAAFFFFIAGLESLAAKPAVASSAANERPPTMPERV